MSVNYLILTVSSSQTIFDASTFIEEVRQRWPGCHAYRETREAMNADAGANVRPTNSSPFTIHHFSKNRMISVDGMTEQAAEVAAWTRSLLPDPNLDLWCTDNFFSGHTILFPGITPQQALDNWVDHREHDPYVEYPEYFNEPPSIPPRAPVHS